MPTPSRKRLHYRRRNHRKSHKNTSNSSLSMNSTQGGLEYSVKHQYTHLGWITLANDEKHYDKVYAYINSNKRLLDTINEKIKKVKSEDSRRDLYILKEKLEKLKIITDKLFDTKSFLKSKLCE